MATDDRLRNFILAIILASSETIVRKRKLALFRQPEDNQFRIALFEQANSLTVYFTGIVRVGGRCGEKMKCCSLKCRRDEGRMNKTIPRRIMRARMEVRDELRELEGCETFQRSSALLKCSRRSILSFQVLKQFIVLSP